MNGFDLTLLVVAGLVALVVFAYLVLIATFARLQRRALATASSDVGTGLKLARGAAQRFWVTFLLGGSVVGAALGATLDACGGPEWGGCFGILDIGFDVLASAVLGVAAALSHGVAVFLLRRTFAVMITSHQVASSALTALGVLVAGFLGVLALGPRGEAWWPVLICAGPLPFVLSILVVRVVSRLRGAHGGGAA
jgi:hypothetical protein